MLPPADAGARPVARRLLRRTSRHDGHAARTKPAGLPSDPGRATQFDDDRRPTLSRRQPEEGRGTLSAGRARLRDLAAPHLRLAQIALVRGNYTEAANRLREAETAQPGWIVTAPDIQAIYGEPADFARQIARLESHLQIHPDDRDAWLVLGAQWFLSGRTAQAADVFQRLNDPKRKADVALAAFLDASNQAKPPPSDDGEAQVMPCRIATRSTRVESVELPSLAMT